MQAFLAWQSNISHSPRLASFSTIGSPFALLFREYWARMSTQEHVIRLLVNPVERGQVRATKVATRRESQNYREDIKEREKSSHYILEENRFENPILRQIFF